MRRWSTIVLSLAALILLLGGSSRGAFSVPVVQAAQSWSVQVGDDPPAGGLTAVTYYPNALTVNVGDTINWNFPSAEPHTVTFDAGVVPPLFASGITPGAQPGSLDLTPIVLPLGAGALSQTYDGSYQLSSGIYAEGGPLVQQGVQAPFSLTLTKPGVYHYECAVHGPGMAGTITVLPAGSALSETPDQATARGQAKLATDVGETFGMEQEFLTALAPLKDVSLPGGTLHPVDAGFGNSAGMAVLAFNARDITVRSGDVVTWNQPDPNEFHTVTFLSGTAGSPVIEPALGPNGPTFTFPAAEASPVGGDTYTGQGVVSSGFLPGGASYTLKIDAPPGTYQYQCLLHDDAYNMIGTITVLP